MTIELRTWLQSLTSLILAFSEIKGQFGNEQRRKSFGITITFKQAPEYKVTIRDTSSLEHSTLKPYVTIC